jgi:hypothetical protein
VVRDIKGSRSRNRVFIVNEVDRRDTVFRNDRVILSRKNDNVGAEQVAVRENKLETPNISHNPPETIAIAHPRSGATYPVFADSLPIIENLDNPLQLLLQT